MQEILKSIRVIHNVLLALCAAILGFALSPNDVSHYDKLARALDAFQSALRARQTEWESHIDEVIEMQTQFSKGLQSALAALEIKIAGNIRPSSLIPLEYGARRVIERPESTLQQILDSLNSEAGAQLFKPDNLTEEIQSWLRPFRNAGAELYEIRLAAVQGAGRPALECYWDLRAKSQIYFANQSRIQADIQQLQIPPRIQDNVDPVTIHVDARIHGNYQLITAETYGRWLLSQSGLSKSPSGADVVKSLVPDVVLGATEIRGMTIPQALKYIDERRTELIEKQNLSLFGVKVAAGTATVLAPLSTLVVLLGLLAYLLNAVRIASGEVRADSNFPWIGCSRMV